MDKEYCPTCGQELVYDDVTGECELKWRESCGKYLIRIEHQGKFIHYIGLENEIHQPQIEKDYRIEAVHKTLDGTGWWFRVLKIRK